MKIDSDMMCIGCSTSIGYVLNYDPTTVAVGLLGAFLIVNVLGDIIKRYRNDA